MTSRSGLGADSPESLLRRVREGDPDAEQLLLAWIFEFALGELRPSHPDLAEDMASEFALAMLEDRARRLARFDSQRGKLEPYLRKALIREVVLREKRRNREVSVDPTDEASVLLWGAAGQSDDCEAQVRLKKALENFLLASSERDREVLTLVVQRQ